MSLVSIIIPVYNTALYLNKCVDSVLGQTYIPIEIILVDDGSTDDSYRLCKEIEAEHNSVHAIHKENGGLSSARLAGFESCHGEYVLFVDSDDYIEPTMVEKLVSAIETNNAKMAMCGYIRVDGKTQTNHYLQYTKNVIDGRDQIIKDYIQPITGHSEHGLNIPGFLCIRLHKRNLIQRDFFASENKYFAEDHVFDLLYSDKVSRIAIVNEPLYDYVIHNTSLTNKYRKHKTEMLHNLYCFYNDFLSKREIPYDEERQCSFIKSMIFSSIDNGVLSGNYIGFREELNLLLAKDYIAIYSNVNGKKLSSIERIIWWLLSLGQYRLLYYLRKWRINVARLMRNE